jgi:hypothetical protein
MYPKTYSKLLANEQDLQNLALRFYNFLREKLDSQSQNSLEIPDLFLDEVYLDYFFYSTKKEDWNEEFAEKGYLIDNITILHPILKGMLIFQWRTLLVNMV